MGDNAICEHGVMRSLCGQEHAAEHKQPAKNETPLEREQRRARVVVNLRGETHAALQALAYGFRGDDLGTPDKVIAKLIADSDARFILDGLGCKTLAEAKALVDLGRTAAMVDADPRTSLRVIGLRDATAAEVADEPEGVLESMANGDLEVSEATRHLAQAELDHRRRTR